MKRNLSVFGSGRQWKQRRNKAQSLLLFFGGRDDGGSKISSSFLDPEPIAEQSKISLPLSLSLLFCGGGRGIEGGTNPFFVSRGNGGYSFCLVPEQKGGNRSCCSASAAAIPSERKPCFLFVHRSGGGGGGGIEQSSFLSPEAMVIATAAEK